MSQGQQKLLDEVFVLLERRASLIFFALFFTTQVSKFAKKIKKRWNSRRILYIDVVLN